MKLQSTVGPTEIEQLFKDHYVLLCLVAYSILKDKDAVQDVVQDFFISYWQKRKSISIQISFQAYAVRAVKNLSLMAIEKSKKEKSFLLNLDKQEYEVQNPVDKSNRYEKILELVNLLPKNRKEIFISFVLHDQSYSKIAQSNGISINTVKTQMKRAYAFLRSKAKDSELHYLLIMTTSCALF